MGSGGQCRAVVGSGEQWRAVIGSVGQCRAVLGSELEGIIYNAVQDEYSI